MATKKLTAFYRSPQWLAFSSTLKAERRNSEGFVICDLCGKPIVKAYDCIAHHKIELTDCNVDDVSVALNPENIELLHFECHNERHRRFGYGSGRSGQKKVYLIYGAPCSGKTTYAYEHAKSDDIVLDVDRLYQAIGTGELHKKSSKIKLNVFKLRDAMLDMIRTRYGNWECAYIIGGYPNAAERERLIDTLGVDQAIFIDTPKEICKERLSIQPEGRDVKEWTRYIDDWYDRYIPPCLP